MPGNILTTASNILCPHGGKAILFTSNRKIFARGAPALLKSDVHIIAGCPFTTGPKYSPCVRIEWSDEASKVTIQETDVLIKSSVGKCFNAEGGIQGYAIISNSQTEASAL